MKRKVLMLLSAVVLCCTLFTCKPEEKYGTIYGTVTDFATGEPVGNANVKLRPNGETTLTGSDGAFEFKDLEAGKYSLLITKAQYADLDDDYIIELKAGEEKKRDVQLRKRVASLKIVDMAGNPLDTLDFGDQESVKVKTFNVFNDGTETLTCTVTYDCEWITNVSGLESEVESGQTVPVTVRIDRVALADGDNTTFLFITSANGSNELVVKASFLGQPVIKTKDPTEVTSNSATVAGKITDDGGRPVLARGICYGTSQSPDISGMHTEDGPGTGEFSHNITGLSSATTYYARAYATNRNGTYYASNIVSFTTNDGLSTVTTTAVTDITATSAKSGGNVTNNGGYNVTARGVCWNTIGSPDLNDQHTTNGNGNGAFTSNLTGLSLNTTYYVRAYATNQMGTSYGEEFTFATNDGSITVVTNEVTEVTSTTAMCGGSVTIPPGNTFPITARGVCWSTSHNPIVTDSHTSDGTGAGSYTSSITGLTVNTNYYVRAYAINETGVFYGEEKNFNTTMGLATVTTKEITGVHPLSATGGGVISSDNGFAVTARGICWSTVQNPTTDDSYTTNGTGAGEFNAVMEGLQNSTTYYVRAYAINANGTAYGENLSFTTTLGEITLTTNDVTEIGETSATCGGNATVSSDNNLPVTAKGVCWSTTHNPTINDGHTDDGSGAGAFVSSMTGLAAGSVNYVRAYATNQLDTFYGDEKTFVTTGAGPTVALDINSFGYISETSVSCSSVVISNGGFDVTSKGVCWSVFPNPTIADSHTTDGSGTGGYSSVLINLDENTTYYVRSYATNVSETSYSEQFVLTVDYRTYLGFPRMMYYGNNYVLFIDHIHNSPVTWDMANTICNNLDFAGFTDWRLPSLEEFSEINNCIGDDYSNYAFWSSTICEGSDMKHIVYIFHMSNLCKPNDGTWGGVIPIRVETEK